MQRKTIPNDLYCIDRAVQANNIDRESIALQDDQAVDDENLILSTLGQRVYSSEYVSDCSSVYESDSSSSSDSSLSDDDRSIEEIPSPANEIDIEIDNKCLLLFFPHEILLQFFHLLPMVDCLNLRTTCKLLAQIGRDASLSRKFSLRLDYNKKPVNQHYIELPDIDYLYILPHDKLAIVFENETVGIVDVSRNAASNEVVLLNPTDLYVSIKLLSLKNNVLAVLSNKRNIDLYDLTHFPVITHTFHASRNHISCFIAMSDDVIAFREEVTVYFYRLTKTLTLAEINRLRLNYSSFIGKMHALEGQNLLLARHDCKPFIKKNNHYLEVYDATKNEAAHWKIDSYYNESADGKYGVISRNKFWHTNHDDFFIWEIDGSGTIWSSHRFPITYMTSDIERFGGLYHTNNHYYFIPKTDKQFHYRKKANSFSLYYSLARTISCLTFDRDSFDWRQTADGIMFSMTPTNNIDIIDLYNANKGTIFTSHCLTPEAPYQFTPLRRARRPSPKKCKVVKLQDGRLAIPVSNDKTSAYGLMLFDFPRRVMEPSADEIENISPGLTFNGT